MPLPLAAPLEARLPLQIALPLANLPPVALSNLPVKKLSNHLLLSYKPADTEFFKQATNTPNP
jgi:hypothetical protein